MNTSEVFGPKHHGGSDDPFETIKVLEHWLTPDEMIGFCKGSPSCISAGTERRAA